MVTGFLYVLIVDCQKMAEVYRRKLAHDKYSTLIAVTLFYSRIILKKLTTENKTTFRKYEKSVKFSVNDIFKYKNCKTLRIFL